MKIEQKPRLNDSGIDFVIPSGKAAATAYLDVDGFYYLSFPDGEGWWTEWTLTELARQLTELNRPYNEFLEENY